MAGLQLSTLFWLLSCKTDNCGKEFWETIIYFFIVEKKLFYWVLSCLLWCIFPTWLFILAALRLYLGLTYSFAAILPVKIYKPSNFYMRILHWLQSYHCCLLLRHYLFCMFLLWIWNWTTDMKRRICLSYHIVRFRIGFEVQYLMWEVREVFEVEKYRCKVIILKYECTFAMHWSVLY